MKNVIKIAKNRKFSLFSFLRKKTNKSGYGERLPVPTGL